MTQRQEGNGSNFVKVSQALTIAGSDSGGAGIQADLKTFQERGVFGMTVVTAITAQNTFGVSDIHSIPTLTISAQLAAIAEDFQPSAFKIGMLGTADIISCVARGINEYDFGLCVLDPVMVAKGGASLLQQSATQAPIEELLPLADVLTPNLPEAEFLSGLKITDEVTLRKAAEKFLSNGAKAVIIKGGHAENSVSNDCQDYVFRVEGNNFQISSPRFNTPHTHSTGCTFSACIIAELAKGNEVKTAIRTAKDFITAAISNPLGIGQGYGPTNHWAYRCG
ncbi:MAG: bifunctional hydroxymethylpyrimidine kinase/phosphomethylpyrimidine kinase [Gammaproteobacteria bacterium]|nr:bifunctional hydroxymethylpyrimidine kinase/phosphomethylpyrimidine kinase [Gammaproteobacteria bacterium]